MIKHLNVQNSGSANKLYRIDYGYVNKLDCYRGDSTNSIDKRYYENL